MSDLNIPSDYSPIDKSELLFELFFFKNKTYESELLNGLISIQNNNALNDNKNDGINLNKINNSVCQIFRNNYNEDLGNDDTTEENSNCVIEINNSQKNNSNNHNVLGRKRKGSESNGEHNEYSEDNMIRKYKIYIIETFKIKINSELKKAPISIESNGIKYKANKLVKINQIFAKNIKVNEMINYLNSKLKTIFSVDISTLYKNKPKNYNKLVIDKLYEENRTNVTCILDKKVIECLKFFKKDEDEFLYEENSCLKGIEKRFESLPQYLKKKGFKDDYIKQFIEIIKDFENIFDKKSPRRARIMK